MALVVQDYNQPSFEGAVAVVADEIVTVLGEHPRNPHHRLGSQGHLFDTLLALLDGSSPDWWFVRTSDGREGAVPSAFLVRDEATQQAGVREFDAAQFAAAQPEYPIPTPAPQPAVSPLPTTT